MAVPLHFEMRTPRLTLRRLTAADAPRLHEIQSNWNVTRMLRMATFPPALDGMRQWLTAHEDEWRAGAAHRFAVVTDGRVIGCADVDKIAAGCGELGYWLEEACWGRGLASEAAAAVLDFAVDTVGLGRLVSGHAADNPASGRVLRKLGFRWIGDATAWSRSRQAEIVTRKYELDPADRAT